MNKETRMKRIYIYCFEFPIEADGKSQKLKREFGHKELKSKATPCSFNFLGLLQGNSNPKKRKNSTNARNEGMGCQCHLAGDC